MNPILLDTNALLWLMAGEKNLGNVSHQMIDAAGSEGKIIISAMSFWEVSMLQKKGRIFLQNNTLEWRKEVLLLGMKEISITGDIGIIAGELENLHGDPADRIIVATAIVNNATLITADEKILEWDGSLRTHNAKK